MYNLHMIESLAVLFSKLAYSSTQIVQKNNYNAQAVTLYYKRDF